MARSPLLASLLALLALLVLPAHAKVEQGTLKLDSVMTEQLIGKFGVASSGDLTLKLTTSKDGWERGKHELHILIFDDDAYAKWRKAIADGSLCRERNKLATVEEKVELPHELATHRGGGWEYFVDPDTGKSYRVNVDSGESEWNSPHNATRVRLEGPAEYLHHREAIFSSKLEKLLYTRRRVGKQRGPRETATVSSHWYVVVSDCALEFYEAHPPPMHYDLQLFDGGSHLPNNLAGMGKLYWALLVAMAAAAAPGAALATRQYARLGRIHVLVLCVAAAYGLQTMSLALELAHLAVFSRDGKGLQWRYTIFAADFAAEVAQGAAELLTSMLLLFLACGWTTVSLATVGSRLLGSLESGGVAEEPTSARGGVARKLSKDVPDGVVAVIKSSLGMDEDDPETKRRVQAVTRALQQPARLVGAAGNAASGVPSRLDVGTLLVFALAATQMWLEVASRAYTDDFSGFHDHEHWPGYGLVCLRCVLAVVFLAGSRVALAAAEMRDPEAARFLRQLRVVGAAWLLAFPFLVVTAGLVPAMSRHRYVAGGCVLLQSGGLIGLGYLCLASEKFLALSSVAPKSASAAGNVLGGRGIAGKIAVD